MSKCPSFLFEIEEIVEIVEIERVSPLYIRKFEMHWCKKPGLSLREGISI